MKEIPYLYEGLNLLTVPEDIKLEFYKIEKDKPKPFTIRYEAGGLIFFCKEGQYKSLFTRINSKEKYYNELNEIVNENNIQDILHEYAKGFNEGYFSFEEDINKKNSFLNNTDESKIHKVFSFIKLGIFDKVNKTGGFPFETDHKNRIKLYNSAFFLCGALGGQFYKAWEIVLHNPTLFENLFNNTCKKENETLDKPAKSKELIKSFGYNEDEQTLKKIYSLLLNNYIDYSTTLEDFKKVFKEDWDLNDIKVKMSCDNTMAGIIFDKISMFFDNLKPINIGASNKFISNSKKNTYITASLLNSSKNQSENSRTYKNKVVEIELLLRPLTN
jgi:hypothetical protein